MSGPHCERTRVTDQLQRRVRLRGIEGGGKDGGKDGGK